VLETVSKPVVYGNSVNEPTPVREGYTPDQEVVKIAKLEGDTTVTVTYQPRRCIVTIVPVDEEGNVLGEETYADGIYNGNVTIVAPEIAHYDPETAEQVIEGITGDMTVNIVYKKTVYQIKLVCKDEEGYPIEGVSDILVDICYGDALHYELPELAGGWIPVQAFADLAAYDGEESLTVVYRLKTFTIQLHFVEVNSDGHRMLHDETVTVTYGDPLNYPVPTIDGYTTTQTEVYLEAVTEEVTEPIVVEYTPAFYKVIIELVDVNGVSVGTQTKEIQAGSSFEIALDPVEGYVTEGILVKGTMGRGDATYQMVLAAVPEETPEPGVDNPEDPKEPENPPVVEDPADDTMTKTIIAIALLVVVLVGTSVTFYFVYLKKR
jgi:hypothetical protein